MSVTYHNPWIPRRALEVLGGETGRILDVGGAAAPYARADHVLDIQPYRPEHLARHAWGAGAGGERAWGPGQYTQADVCAGGRWPFDDQAFDLALCSHSLEDLRDPLPVVAEMNRVARRILVIAPSRLLEQTRGVEHPAFCGFDHHPWMVFEEDGGIVFRRKTPAVHLAGCHLVCPGGRRLPTELGAVCIHGAGLRAQERVFWSLREDVDEYRAFLEPWRGRRDLFVPDPGARSWRHWVWRWRQLYQGAT